MTCHTTGSYVRAHLGRLPCQEDGAALEALSPVFSAERVRASPNSSNLAVSSTYRLTVLDAKTLRMLHLFSCMDAIEHIEWSCDSKFIVCGIFARGLAQVWSTERPEWHCTVDEGPVGLAHVRFSPDGRHLLATADFNVRITVWSLMDRSVYYIRFPKFPRAGLCFSPDGRCTASAAHPTSSRPPRIILPSAPSPRAG